MALPSVITGNLETPAMVEQPLTDRYSTPIRCVRSGAIATLRGGARVAVGASLRLLRLLGVIRPDDEVGVAAGVDA